MNPYLLGAAGVGAVALLAFKDSTASIAPASDQDGGFSIEYSPPGQTPVEYGAGDSPLPDVWVSDTPTGGPLDNTESNLSSFLYLIRLGESSDNYGVLVGGGIFTDYSHHPGWTDARMVKKSAWGANALPSHAAGAYQFQPGTFKECCDALGLDGSMSPDNQDACAVYLLKRRDAYTAVLAGDVITAAEKLKPEWEFFQKWNINKVASTFENNGGTLA